MKIVIVLACLMALAAAVDQSETVVEDADLNVAEHRRHGYGGYGHGGYRGGYGGGWGGYHRGGWGRKRRSAAAEEDAALLTDLETAEHRRSGWGHRGGHYGGWGHRGGFGGYGGYGGYGYYG